MRKWILAALCLLLALVCAGRAEAWRTIDAIEARALLETREDVVLLDVRTAEEYREGHIPGAVNLPNERINGRAIAALPDRAQTILVYCRSGSRSAMAAQKLAAMGYTGVLDMGGYLDWKGETVQGDDPGAYARTPLQLFIGGEEVAVEWEDNAAAEALRVLAVREPVQIDMTMYGGFEQVGPIGEALPAADGQITAQPGDIVLYSGDQIVLFYGSNTWAYTRLGRIADRTEEELAALLGADDVTITLNASGKKLPQAVDAPYPEGTRKYTLQFSSFDGGGPEYDVVFEDEGIASCVSEKRYYDPDHDQMTGAGYAVYLHFTGIAPGTTRATVRASSPIAENWTSTYVVRVDEDLCVSMYLTGELESLFFTRGGYTIPITFRIGREGDAYTLVANGGDPMPLDVDAADAVYAVIVKYQLWLWDGFNGSDPYVLDGEGFSLEYATVGGWHMAAHGDNSFPEHYWDAMGEIESILREASGLDWYD